MIFRGAVPVLLTVPSVAFASSMEAPSLTNYLLKVGLSVALLAIGGYAVLFFSGRRAPFRTRGALSVVASLSLGRDAVVVVRCGPDVIALLSGKNGSRVIGRWRYEEWVAEATAEDTNT